MTGNPKPRSPKLSRGRGPDRGSKSTSTSSASPAEDASERAPGQINFEFLNFSHPSDAKASRARRTVRSHVTRQQHQKEQQAAAAARRTKNSPHVEEAPSAWRPPPLETHLSFPMTGYSSGISTLQMDGLDGSEATSSVTSTSASPLPSPVKTPPVRGHPFDVYPAEWHASIPRVVDYYLTTIAQDNADLDGPGGQRLLRTVWLPFVLTDPTLLHSVVLLAASYYGAELGSDSHAFDIYTLRGMAMRGITEHIGNPATSLSDELIGSVLNVAAYEALFGDRDAYATHMSGLQKIVQLRGGLGALGLNGFLERMLLWFDSNGSYLAGYNVFFDKTNFPSSVEHPVLNPSWLDNIRRDSHSRP